MALSSERGRGENHRSLSILFAFFFAFGHVR
jgi:hypothetical protein